MNSSRTADLRHWSEMIDEDLINRGEGPGLVQLEAHNGVVSGNLMKRLKVGDRV